VLERFALAEMLFAPGRDDEALARYEGLRENTVAELVFSGPALLRQAAIHRRAGRARRAAGEAVRGSLAVAGSRAERAARERYGR
jgi:hypothetical protein